MYVGQQRPVDVQNRRGGRVKLMSILLPETEFNHKEKVRGGTFTCDITRAG